MKRNFKEILETIEAFVFDVDGVFTNGKVLITSEGEFLRQYNMKDGLAVVRAREMGYPIAIISGGKGEQLKKRMKMLKIEHIYLKQTDKTEALEEFSMLTGIPLNKMLYMGDDYPDIAPMKMVGLAVAPKDAIDDVRTMADYTSAFRGGEGCVRDAVEQVLRARNDWFKAE